MRFVPRPGRIYAILDSVESKKVGSIFIADMHSEPTRIGTIQAVGKDIEDLKPGDRILVSFSTGVVIDLMELHRHNAAEGGGQDIHRIYTPYEILAVVEDEKSDG